MDHPIDITPLNNLLLWPTFRLEKFLSKIDRPSEDSCWTWNGCTDRLGYARFRVSSDRSKSSKLSHRLSYELSVGPIPKGWHLHHKCENTSCCNPRHLEPLTPKEHVYKTPNCPSFKNSLLTHCPKGHPYEGENLTLSQGRRRCKECWRIAAEDKRNARRKKLGLPDLPSKGFCSKGHPLSGDNLYEYQTKYKTKDGVKVGVGKGCKECRYQAKKTSYKKNRDGILVKRKEKYRAGKADA